MSTGKRIEFGESRDLFQTKFHRLRRGTSLQGQSVACLIVGGAVPPAAEQDAEPFERKGSHGAVMRLAAFALLVIKGSRPHRFSGRQPGPFMKGLAQELRTGPAPMHPFLLTATLSHRRNAGIALERRCRGVAVSLSSKCRDQSGDHG